MRNRRIQSEIGCITHDFRRCVPRDEACGGCGALKMEMELAFFSGSGKREPSTFFHIQRGKRCRIIKACLTFPYGMKLNDYEAGHSRAEAVNKYGRDPKRQCGE